MIEALAHCKCIITTKKGIEGLEESEIQDKLILSDNSHGWVKELSFALENKNVVNTFENKAYKWSSKNISPLFVWNDLDNYVHKNFN